MIDLTGYPDGTRVIVRRERPHPGARLSLFDFDEGMRTWPFSRTPRSRVGEPRNAWRPAPARMPAWRSASACSSGPRPCCWTASWPPPSPRSSATGCCTPPPASPAEAADSASGSPLPGAGDTSWPAHSPASQPCPGQPPDRSTVPALPRPEEPMPSPRPATQMAAVGFVGLDLVQGCRHHGALTSSRRVARSSQASSSCGVPVGGVIADVGHRVLRGDRVPGPTWTA